MRHLNLKKTVSSPLLPLPSRKIALCQWRRLLPQMGYLKKKHFQHSALGLGPGKKSTRWVHKLLNDEQKQGRVRVCSDFIAAIHGRSKSMLDCIVTTDKTMVSYHNRETKKQSKQWIPKGELGPLKVRVHANQTKQMVMTFFNSGGLIYTPIISRGAAIKATSTIKALGKFLEHFKKNGPTMAQQQ